jgi:hypothetical protein
LPIPLLLLLLLFPLAQGKTTDDLPPIFANRPKLKKPAAAAATLKFSTLPGVHLLPLQVLNFAAGNSYSSSSWWVFSGFGSKGDQLMIFSFLQTKPKLEKPAAAAPATTATLLLLLLLLLWSS